MDSSIVREVLEFVEENDVKFIRLAFCDLFGAGKNISIMPDRLRAAFEHGVSFDAHAVKGFRDVNESDLLLFPDPATLTTLPWRPGPGRVVRFYCDIKNPDGSEFARDTRCILKHVEARAEKMGYACKIGAECEFYLFKTDNDGNPTNTPFDKGGYLDIAPTDRGENVRREICHTLEDMGITPECSHHEQGPGQNEIDFKFSSALKCADNIQTFKTVVKTVAARNGLHASFMPKPILGMPGSGMHINVSLERDGLNIFMNTSEGHSVAAESFIAGVLKRTPEMTMFLNPLVNSYERFGEFEAPRFVSWSHQNRSQLVRIPAAKGEKMRMELRSPDPSLNPYLAFALVLSAGLDGVENGLELPKPLDVDLYNADESVTKKLERLPESLEDAIDAAKRSDFVKKAVGEELTVKFAAIKKEETEEFASAMKATRSKHVNGDAQSDLDTDAKAVFYRNMYFDTV